MKEGLYYYYDSRGHRVMTAARHLKRGFCCKNQCRHCPWRYNKPGHDTSNSVFIDMDGVLADFERAMLEAYPEAAELPDRSAYADLCQATPGFYRGLPPIDGAIDAYHRLNERYDLWILSAPSWENPHSYAEKNEWCREFLGASVEKRLILTHNKGMHSGRALIDDRTKYGADIFVGEHIHFGTDKFPNWRSVLDYLL